MALRARLVARSIARRIRGRWWGPDTEREASRRAHRANHGPALELVKACAQRRKRFVSVMGATAQYLRYLNIRLRSIKVPDYAET